MAVNKKTKAPKTAVLKDMDNNPVFPITLAQNIIGDVGSSGTEVEANPVDEATDKLEKIKIDNSIFSISTGSIVPLTTEPTADNPDGDLKIVILDVEPAHYYDGYWYLIKS